MTGSRAQSPSLGQLLQRGLWLEYATLGWNIVGCGIVLAAAWLAHSVALAGFGLDSVIEILASIIVVWQLKGSATPHRERRALRLIGAAFFALALYILAQSAYTLLTGTTRTIVGRHPLAGADIRGNDGTRVRQGAHRQGAQ